MRKITACNWSDPLRLRVPTVQWYLRAERGSAWPPSWIDQSNAGCPSHAGLYFSLPGRLFFSLLSHCLLLPALTSSQPCLQWISPPCPQSPKTTCTQVLSTDCGLDNSVQFSHSVMSNSLRPHGLQHARPPCPSATPGAYSNSRPSSRWCNPTVSSSVVPFSSHLQSFPASVSFQMSQFFTSGSQSIGVLASASVLPMNIQDWFPLGLTSWISLQSKRLSRVFSNTTVQNHQFSGTQPSLCSNSHIHTWLQGKP